MKYSYTWLKELSGTKKSPKELADLLTMRAFELEEMKTEGKETQLEFSILPNRGHNALSHIGMAQEICAVEGRGYRESAGARLNLKPGLKVEIKDKKLCLRYVGAIIENIKVAVSPKWMQERLLVSGVKPINNIVDVTNYVMLETGQPLHAFDAEKTTGNIIVRKAKRGEEIRLLDEKIYELNENNLVIADSEKVLALAGVMGGFDSSISDKTTSIILESANFNSTSVRKTRTLHNIITESSHRFEREIDPNLAGIAMARAIEHFRKVCGPKIGVSAITDAYLKKINPWPIKLDTDYVNRLLGEKIAISRMKNILENLGINAKATKNILVCEIPTRRIDLENQEDLIEEIGRVYGYENIEEQAPVVSVKTPPENLKRNFENDSRDIMTGFGFSEVMNYSFYGKEDIDKCRMKEEAHIEVSNPLSLEQQYLRRSLVPNILKNIELNLKNFPKIKIFEIGNKFCNDKGKFSEGTILMGALADNSAKDSLFFELKGKLQSFLDKIDIKNIEYQGLDAEYKFWNRSRAAKIICSGKKIGRIGEIHPQVLAKYGIKQRVAVFGLKISDLMEMKLSEKRYEAIRKFPSVKRDISMFIGENIKYSDIERNIHSAGAKLILGVELFDIFEKAGEKSLALRIEIGSSEKTLTFEEIDGVMGKIISALEKELKVKVRK
jgi:phenylalanyl-tRNA synthetase beta chain